MNENIAAIHAHTHTCVPSPPTFHNPLSPRTSVDAKTASATYLPQVSQFTCVHLLQCVAVCCSVLQRVGACAVRYSVLQCVAVRCSVLQGVAARWRVSSVSQCAAVCCSVLQRVQYTAVRCNVLQRVGACAVCCSVLQCVAEYQPQLQ